MLSAEKQFILNCLSDYCNHRKTTEPAEQLNYGEVLKLAEEQSMAALIYYQCADWMNYGFLDNAFRKAVIQEGYFAVNRTYLFKELVTYMENKKIPFICMKGSVFKNLYDIPEIRSMGDIDIIVRQEDKEKVNDIFVDDMKFTKFVDNHSVWTYYLNNIEYEVHNHMFYEDLTNDFDYIGFFDHIFEHCKHGTVFDTESNYLYVPEDNWHFLYLMTHTAKHIINNGSGFRAYIDMVMMAQKCNIDWDWVAEELKKMQLLNFTETCFALCEKWFNVKMPLKHKELDDAFFNEITEKTFNDGVFGLENKENEGAHSAKEITRDRKGYWFTAIRLTLKILFPPYNDMILAPWYSWLKGKPWLLPIAWVYKWFYCATHKLGYSLKRLAEPFKIREKIEKRENYIKDWGL